MRAGLVIYGDLDTITGGYLYDRRLVEHMRACGDEVSVFSLAPGSYLRHLRDNLSSALLQDILQSDVEVLIEDELNHPSLVRLNTILRTRRRPAVVSIVHHLRCSEQRPDWQNALYRMVEKAYLTRVDGFIFNSRTTRKTVEQTIRSRTCGVVALPAANVHPGSDRAHVCEHRMRQASPLRVLFVGTLVPRKGLLALIEAMRLLRGHICRLDVVGDMTVDPPYAGEAGNRVRRYGLEALVTFHGGVRPSQLGCLYESSHVLAVPSSYEGYGVVYLEAMGFGLPVIAGTRGAAHEIVTHGTNGFLVEPDSPDAIAAALETLALDRDRRVRMSRAALSRARSQPTWEQSMSQARDFMLALTRSKDAVGGSTATACHKS